MLRIVCERSWVVGSLQMKTAEVNVQIAEMAVEINRERAKAFHSPGSATS